MSTPFLASVAAKVKAKAHVFALVALIFVFFAWNIYWVLSLQRSVKEENSIKSMFRVLMEAPGSKEMLFQESTVAALTQTGTRYAYTEEYGFGVSFDDGATWLMRNEGLPIQRIYPFRGEHIKRITSIGIDPKAENRVAVATLYGIQISSNYGETWVTIPLGKPVSKNDTFTSVALCPDDKGKILVGTSFSGFYETSDMGVTWTNPSEDQKDIYQGAGFYETISSLSYVPGNPNECIFCTEFSDTVYSFDLKEHTITPMKSPGNPATDRIASLSYEWSVDRSETTVQSPRSGSAQGNGIESKSWEALQPRIFYALYARTLGSRFIYNPASREWGELSRIPPRVPNVGREKLKRAEVAKGKYGIYLTAYHAGSESRFNEHVRFMKDKGFDSVVIEMKDDYGLIAYDSNLAIAKDIGSIDKRMNIRKVIETLHENHIYCIARLIIFKDKTLYEYNGYQFAVWDKTTGAAWTNGKEQWVDPYSDFVWTYNISIASELERAGVDEIQFDYVRFPTDGATQNIVYRYNKEGQTMVEAIASFLAKARETLSVPISIDVYGFNAWYDMGTNMGQNIQALAEYADVICPMFYPSHFSKWFYYNMGYVDRAKFIYKEGSNRANFIAGGKALIRPYVQAFLLGDEKLLSEEDQEKYLANQCIGTKESNADGFALWNSANNYYMVTKPISEYAKSDENHIQVAGK